MDRDVNPVIFALEGTRALGEKIAQYLDVPLSAHEERDFVDGEHKARPLVNVRGRDVYVVHSLYSDESQSVNDKLCRLLFFIGAVRDAGAARVTVAIPYFAYARKDRRTKARDPLTTRYSAMLLEAMGIDAVMALDIHNLSAFQNAFRCEAIHLNTRKLFTTHLAAQLGDGPVAVVSPDPGGVKRAQLFRETLEQTLEREVGSAFLDKRRSNDVVTGSYLVGDVQGATVLVVDDLISSGGTMLRAAKACLSQGARQVYAVAAHGLFVGKAAEVVGDPHLEKTYITDSVPPFRLDPALVAGHVDIVSVAPLFGEAIKRCHEGGSLVDLLGGPS